MFKKGFAITIIFIISTLVQLVSQIVVTRIFGATLTLDTFLAAVAVPTIVVTVIYGTLNDVFLPLFGEKKVSNPDEADDYFISHVIILTVSSFLLAWILGFFTQPLSSLLYSTKGVKFVTETATQMRYLFFSIPLSVIATMLGSYFYAHKKFIRFPLAQLAGSIVNLGLIWILAPKMGIWAMVVAFVLNIMFQILLVIPHFKFKLQADYTHFLPVVIAWVPLIIGNLAIRSDAVLIRSFGSYLPNGYLVYLNLISKMFSLAAGMTTIGIQVLLLPHLVEYINQNDKEKTVATVNKAKIAAIMLSIGTAIVVMLIAPVFIHMAFVGGKFSSHDAEITTSLLPLFVVPTIGWGTFSIFFQPLLAMKKRTEIAIISVLALSIAWGGASVLSRMFGALPAITGGLIILYAVAIIGSEFVWQYTKKNIPSAQSSS